MTISINLYYSNDSLLLLLKERNYMISDAQFIKSFIIDLNKLKQFALETNYVKKNNETNCVRFTFELNYCKINTFIRYFNIYKSEDMNEEELSQIISKHIQKSIINNTYADFISFLNFRYYTAAVFFKK